jgi:hypothetical protein
MTFIACPIVIAGIFALRRTKEQLLIKKEFAVALGVGLTCFAANLLAQGLYNVFPDVNFNWPTTYMGSMLQTTEIY